MCRSTGTESASLRIRTNEYIRFITSKQSKLSSKPVVNNAPHQVDSTKHTVGYFGRTSIHLSSVVFCSVLQWHENIRNGPASQYNRSMRSEEKECKDERKLRKLQARLKRNVMAWTPRCASFSAELNEPQTHGLLITTARCTDLLSASSPYRNDMRISAGPTLLPHGSSVFFLIYRVTKETSSDFTRSSFIAGQDVVEKIRNIGLQLKNK